MILVEQYTDINRRETRTMTPCLRAPRCLLSETSAGQILPRMLGQPNRLLPHHCLNVEL